MIAKPLRSERGARQRAIAQAAADMGTPTDVRKQRWNSLTTAINELEASRPDICARVRAYTRAEMAWVESTTPRISKGGKLYRDAFASADSTLWFWMSERFERITGMSLSRYGV